MSNISRRDFLKYSAVASAAAGMVLTNLPSVHAKKKTRDYTEILLDPNIINVDQSPYKVRLEYYPGKNSERTITIRTAAGKPESIEREIAEYFSSRGFQTYLVDSSAGPQENVEARLKTISNEGGIEALCNAWNGMVIQQTVDEKLISDFVRSEQNQNKGLATVGNGFGGINSIMANAKYRKAKEVLADVQIGTLVGGNIARIIARTPLPKIAETREAYLEKRGLTQEDLEVELSQRITQDPLSFEQGTAGGFDPENTYIIMPRLPLDSLQIIPTTCERALIEKIGEPVKTRKISIGVRRTLSFVPGLRRILKNDREKIFQNYLNFIEERFEAQDSVSQNHEIEAKAA